MVDWRLQKIKQSFFENDSVGGWAKAMPLSIEGSNFVPRSSNFDLRVPSLA
jgi:hypothetical protein